MRPCEISLLDYMSPMNQNLRMAQAIMNPEEVCCFASELKRFIDDVQGRASVLRARFAALGNTRQDQEHFMRCPLPNGFKTYARN